MYTLLGRALLALIVQPDSSNYIWRFFCRITDPVVALVALVTPKAAAPVVIWLFGVVWLFWLRVGLLYLFLVFGARPKRELSRVMERNYYYIGIAFFGMINGLFNRRCWPSPMSSARSSCRSRCSAAKPLTYFSSLMLSTATIILGGIPAAIYEHVVGAKEDSTVASLWIWLAGTAVLTLPAIGNFLTDRAIGCPRFRWQHTIVAALRRQ